MTDRGKEFLIRNTSIINLQRNRVNKFRAIPARKRSARPQGIYDLHAGGADGGEDAASYPITFLSGIVDVQGYFKGRICIYPYVPLPSS
jgi:hypothetical protein